MLAGSVVMRGFRNSYLSGLNPARSKFLCSKRRRVLSKQPVPAVEPGLYSLNQEEVGYGKQRDRAQQRQR